MPADTVSGLDSQQGYRRAEQFFIMAGAGQASNRPQAVMPDKPSCRENQRRRSDDWWVM